MLVNHHDLRHNLQRETPKVITTTFIEKCMKGTQVIPVPNGNKVEYDKIFEMDDPQCDLLSALLISI